MNEKKVSLQDDAVDASLMRAALLFCEESRVN